MIIGATRIRAGAGHQRLSAHVWRGAGNDSVTTMRGTEADLEDMNLTATSAGRRYAIRHYHLSPGEPMSDAEALELMERIAAEFGFRAEAAVVVRHGKARRTRHDPILGSQGFDTHWHVLAPEVDPVTMRVLDSSWMYPRQELLAREAELRLLHQVVKGRWNTSVGVELEARGEHEAASRLRAAGVEEGWPAYAAYSSRQRRLLERRHRSHKGDPLDLPSLVQALGRCWATHAIDRPALDAALRRQGLRLRHAEEPVGDRADGAELAPAPPTTSVGWVVDAWDGRRKQAYVLGAAHQLLREPRNRVVDTLRVGGKRQGPADAYQTKVPEPVTTGLLNAAEVRPD